MSCHVRHGSTRWRLKKRKKHYEHSSGSFNSVHPHKTVGTPEIDQWVKGFILLPKCGDLSLIAGAHIYIKRKNRVPELSCDLHTYAVTHTHNSNTL